MDARKEFERGFGKKSVVEIDGFTDDDSDRHGTLLSAKRIKTRRQDWLWHGWLAYGALAFLTGDPGAGKGLFEADLISRVSRAKRFPDGTRAPRIQTVVYSKEENLETTFVPRLKAARADLERIKFALPARGHNGKKPAPLPALPEGIEHVARNVARSGARFVIFDPIFHFLPGGADTNSETVVFDVLEPLIELAQQLNIAVMCIRHPNKKTEVSGMYRMLGSAAFAQIPRTILTVKQMPADKDARMLISEKYNLTPQPSALPFRIVEGANNVAHIEWDKPLTREQEEAALEGGALTQTQVERAREMVKRMLAKAPAYASTIKREGEAMGISRGSLHRAYRELDVESWPDQDDRTGLMKGWVLSLPGRNGRSSGQRARADEQPTLGFNATKTT